MIEKYNHIIWDWNGTLLDDTLLCLDIINKMLEKRHMPNINLSDYHSLLDFPIINYYKALGFDFSRESFKDIAAEFVNAYKNGLHKLRLQPDANKVLLAIKEMGLTQSILSASEQNSLISAVKSFSIDTFFVDIKGLDNTYAASKIELGCRHLHDLALNPKKTLLIGDTTHDFNVAENMGCDVMLVSFGHQSDKRLKECSCPVIESFSSLLQNRKSLSFSSSNI